MGSRLNCLAWAEAKPTNRHSFYVVRLQGNSSGWLAVLSGIRKIEFKGLSPMTVTNRIVTEPTHDNLARKPLLPKICFKFVKSAPNRATLALTQFVRELRIRLRVWEDQGPTIGQKKAWRINRQITETGVRDRDRYHRPTYS
jgi:hypothetical protein